MNHNALPLSSDETEEEGEEEGISQVSEPSDLGKKIGFGVLVAVLLAFAGLHWMGDKKPKATPQAEAVTPDYQASPDKGIVAPANHSTDGSTTESALQQIQVKANATASNADDKFYRLQQNAPISMYEASATTAAPSYAVSTSGAPGYSSNGESVSAGGNLPLSFNQINKLRSLMGATDPNSQFQQTVSNTPVETVNATKIAHVDYTVTQGTLIPGSLETAINSDMPGMVRAVVSSDVYSSSGSQVLVPRGSKLIGQYNSGLNMGQQRLMIVWTRVIRPDGIDVMLGSPGTDALGQGGLGADHLNTHFWERFGQASLLSIIGGGIATAGVSGSDNDNSASQYRMMLSNNFQQISGSALASTMNIKPTIQVDQGAMINVFVNRDLSFYGVLSNDA